MSDVFISYSRKDGDFAKKLTSTLAETGRDIWIDWEDIARGSDWLHEIFAGIEAADTFVFIISQNSLTSEICNIEVQHARQHNKRIIPLILQEIRDDTEKYVKGTWFDQERNSTLYRHSEDLGFLPSSKSAADCILLAQRHFADSTNTVTTQATTIRGGS